MSDQRLVDELHVALASPAPLAARSRAVLGCLARHLSYDAAWLALAHPTSGQHVVVATRGLGAAGVAAPLPGEDVVSLGDRLREAGRGDAVGVPLLAAGGVEVGCLGVLPARGRSTPAVSPHHLARLAAVIARGLSPVHALAAGARLVPGAVAGVVLLEDGAVDLLPGLGSHRLLAPGSAAVGVARRVLADGDVFRSFLWPDQTTGTAGHVRLSVLAATDAPAFALGVVLVTPRVDCHGLTRRELEVLGLLVDGLSNQEVADRLVVSQRTVAAHVEHLLHKLDVPTRTLAAVRAEREGCYVPGAAPTTPEAPVRR